MHLYALPPITKHIMQPTDVCLSLQVIYERLETDRVSMAAQIIKILIMFLQSEFSARHFK